LSATILRRRITGALRSGKNAATAKAAEIVTQNTVYSYPTIASLSAYLAEVVANPFALAGAQNSKIAIENMIDKYGVGLDTSKAIELKAGSPERKVVLLTGTTGNLGAQLLAELLANKEVEKIYAFNRPGSGSLSILDRHKERFLDKGLDSALLASDRLVFVEGDAALPNLGLSQDLYVEVRVVS
jgi:FlaA1/EpsC-like NDP-sugar epimerase